MIREIDKIEVINLKKIGDDNSKYQELGGRS